MIRNVVLSAILCITLSAPGAFAATSNGLVPHHNARNQVQMMVASCNWACQVNRAATEHRYKNAQRGYSGVRG